VYKIDPRLDSFTRNLLSKEDWRSVLLNEPGKIWPEVPLVSKPFCWACAGERLAWATSGPYRSVVSPTSSSKSVRPDADACKEMALGVPTEVIGRDI
jgi:hypothetical protein